MSHLKFKTFVEPQVRPHSVDARSKRSIKVVEYFSNCFGRTKKRVFVELIKNTVSNQIVQCNSNDRSRFLWNSKLGGLDTMKRSPFNAKDFKCITWKGVNNPMLNKIKCSTLAAVACLPLKEFLLSRIRAKVENISIIMTIFGCGGFVLFQVSAAVVMKHLSDYSLTFSSCSRQLINSSCLREAAYISLINLITETFRTEVCINSID